MNQDGPNAVHQSNLPRSDEYFFAAALPPKIRRILALALAAGAALLAFWLTYFAGATLVMPYPVEYREGAAQVITALLLQGRNPFSMENQPLGTNNYGMGYNLVVLPFAALFGNTLLVHRAVTFVFIALIACLVFVVIQRASGHRWVAVLSGLVAAVGMSARAGLGAYPNAMGTALFLGAIYIPLLYRYGFRSLAVSALLCIAAFYTKPYFVMGFGIVASYVFLFISKKKGVAFGLMFAIPFGATFLIVRHFFPFYFIDTVVSNLVSTKGGSYQYMTAQLAEGFREYPLLVILALLLMSLRSLGAIRKLRTQGIRPASWNAVINLRSADLPLFAWNVSLYAYSLICSLVAFVLALGVNVGAYMTYLYQLVLPLILIWLFSQVRPATRLAAVSTPVLIFSALLLCSIVLRPSYLAQAQSDAWPRLYRYVDTSRAILNSPVTTSRIVERGLWPTDSGHSEYFDVIHPYPDSIRVGASYETVQYRRQQYAAYLRQQIANRRFDTVLLTAGDKPAYLALIRKYYLVVDHITVPMPQVDQVWTIDVWKPIGVGP